MWKMLSPYGDPAFLPKVFQDYHLRTHHRPIRAFLDWNCSFKIKYQSTITGVSSKAVSPVLFLWINVVVVPRVDGELQFSISLIATSFSDSLSQYLLRTQASSYLPSTSECWRFKTQNVAFLFMYILNRSAFFTVLIVPLGLHVAKRPLWSG